jgi:hypothetical protein
MVYTYYDTLGDEVTETGYCRPANRKANIHWLGVSLNLKRNATVQLKDIRT